MRKRSLLLLVLVLCLQAPVQSQETYTGPFHIESKPARRVRVQHTVTFRAPQLQAHAWIVFAAEPPALPGLTDIRMEMNFPARLTTEVSPLHRPVLAARVPVTNADLGSGITIETLVELTLVERKLVAGAPPKPVPALSQEARSAATIFTPTVDYSQPDFQAWLAANGLRRQATEGVIAFAHRAYLQITENYSYKYVPAQDRRASALCKVSSTDCGGVVCLYVATLRANDIPARALVGRWAQTSKGESDYGMTHVKSEFFGTGVG